MSVEIWDCRKRTEKLAAVEEGMGACVHANGANCYWDSWLLMGVWCVDRTSAGSWSADGLDHRKDYCHCH